MRKMHTGILLILLLFLFCACGAEKDIAFYYSRAAYQYSGNDGVIASDIREAPGHEEDLQYLLALYLEGPVDQSLVSPFPQGTVLVDCSYSAQAVEITLRANFDQFSDLKYTIASACIAHTCFDLTDAAQVTVKYLSGETTSKTITLNRDSFLLEDTVESPVTTES